MATRKYAYCQEPSKIILPLTAQRICDGSSRDKNSCRSFAKLSAWWLAPIAVCRKSPPCCHCERKRGNLAGAE